MRKLATIKTVTDIQPIENADAIEVATVDKGWKVVVKKGEFNIGDNAVYFEIDSILPESDKRYEFLMKDVKDLTTDENTIVRGFKLKTIKLRGQISQGLALPLNLFPELNNNYVGDDITSILGIKKYEKYITCNEAKGSFPSFIQKTDQERVQNLWNKLDFHEKFEVTLKIDGCSGTFYNLPYNDDYVSGLCSRNMELKINEDVNTVWHTVKNKYHILPKLQQSGLENIAIQGEVYGLNCNGNPEKLNDTRFAVFNIFDIATYQYLNPQEAKSICDNLNLDYVPVLHNSVSLNDLNIKTLDDLLKLAEVKSLNTDTGEGIVFKSLSRPDFSFKVINNKYLLKDKS